MSDKVFEIENKWNEGCESGNMDVGDLFGQLLDVAYSLGSRNRLREQLIRYELKMNCPTDEQAEQRVDSYLATVNP